LVRTLLTQIDNKRKVKFFYFTQFLLLHYLWKADQAKYALKSTGNLKNIPHIVDRNLKKD